MSSLKKTLLHTIELAIVLLAAWLITIIFNLEAEQIQMLCALVIGALVKFARASDKMPIKDYVNQE